MAMSLVAYRACLPADKDDARSLMGNDRAGLQLETQTTGGLPPGNDLQGHLPGLDTVSHDLARRCRAFAAVVDVFAGLACLVCHGLLSLL